MLNVQQVRLRFISARLLASAPPIFKSGGNSSFRIKRKITLISTAMEGGEIKQKRCFCIAKTRHQQMYMDVHLLMRYLPALFSSASVFKMTTKPLSSYDAFAYQNRHGCCWFHAAVSFLLLQKTPSQKCTWMYIFDARNGIGAVSFLLLRWCSSSLRREKKRCGSL